MARPTKTTEELTKAAEHTYYEIWMFLRIPGQLRVLEAMAAPNPRPKETQVSWNALIEAGAIHGRILFEFLDPPRNVRPTDIIASDFCTNWQPVAWSPDIEQLRQRVKTKANKCVAHLTYDRAEWMGDLKPWDFDEMIKAMAPHLLAFISTSSIQLENAGWASVGTELRAALQRAQTSATPIDPKQVSVNPSLQKMPR